MKQGHLLWLGAASTALMLAACSTTEETPRDITGGDSSTGEVITSNRDKVQSVPTPLDPVPSPPPPAPSPAPLVSAPTGDAEAFSEVVVTGSRIKREGETTASSVEAISSEAIESATSDVADVSRIRIDPDIDPIVPDEPPRPQPEPQSGLLTAGDYDDVLNPELYKTYLDKMLQEGGLGRKDLPYVDAADRIEIRITDRLGKPMPFADISLAKPQGEKMFPLRTGANGMAYIYPNFDMLEAGTIISVSMPDASPMKQVLSANDIAGGGELAFVLDRDAPKVQKLDVLLTLDATGSMSDEMRYLQTELTSIMSRMERNNPGLDIQAGLIVYRDNGDEYVIRDFDFTGDLDAFKVSLSQQSANGGGDFPEAMDVAQTKGLGLSWREDAIKVNLLVADAPPHDEKINATWNTALHARVRGIHTVPLAASGVDPTAEFLMRSMAQVTGGRYLFLTDDSGVGNPHAEPTVDCYVVTPVNALVQRVLESLVAGVRAEPEGDTVIRTVGNYQAGVCKLDHNQ